MNDEIVKWLEEQASSQWQPIELACLNVLKGFRLHDSANHAQAVSEFERGFEVLGKAVPQRERVWRSFLRSVCELGQRERELAERACQWAVKLELAETVRWNHDYYWVLHNAQRYDEAESYCRRVLEEDRREVQAHTFLGHMLAEHSKVANHNEDAEKVYLDGLAVDESDATLHFFLADLLSRMDRYTEAEKEYRRAFELVYDRRDKGRILGALSKMLDKVPGRNEEAKSTRRESLKLDPDNAQVLNSLAWSLYLSNSELKDAKNYAQRATELKSGEEYILQTYAAILVRSDQWEHAKVAVRKWLSLADPDRVRQMWRDDGLLFIDAARNGHADELASLLPTKPGHVVWEIISAALRAYSDESRAAHIANNTQQEIVEKLLAQLRSGALCEFPPVE